MKEAALVRLERKIVIGMIIDTAFLDYIDQIIETEWCQSNDARTLMTWVLDYFHKYKKAPGLKIQDIYEDHLDSGKLEDAQAEVIEMILEDLSSEVEDWDPEDIGLLKDQAVRYCNYTKLKSQAESIDNLLESNDLEDAKALASEYKPIQVIESMAVEPLATDEQLDAVFADRKKPLISYPGDLGQVISPHMVRQGFVVYLAQNKGGKSFHLMDAGIRGARQGKKVLFVQGGDMSQVQMERRIAIYNTCISDQERYCGTLYIPVVDCRHNQMGTCEHDFNVNGDDREGPFEDESDNFYDNDLNYRVLVEAFGMNKRYKPCQECRRTKKYKHDFKGAMWYKKRPKIDPLTKHEYLALRRKSKKKFDSPFHAMRNIKVSTYSNESLSMDLLERELDVLADKEKFEPDIVVADYLDLFMPDSDTRHMIFRDQENKKYQRSRKCSQDRDLLFLSASQSDADGFNKRLLDKSNFSEDRRKLDHVTAMLGLNMSITEKQLGIMRINEIVARETEGTSIVNVHHRLQMGRPILGSYF